MVTVYLVTDLVTYEVLDINLTSLSESISLNTSL